MIERPLSRTPNDIIIILDITKQGALRPGNGNSIFFQEEVFWPQKFYSRIRRGHIARGRGFNGSVQLPVVLELSLVENEVCVGEIVKRRSIVPPKQVDGGRRGSCSDLANLDKKCPFYPVWCRGAPRPRSSRFCPPCFGSSPSRGTSPRLRRA